MDDSDQTGAGGEETIGAAHGSDADLAAVADRLRMVRRARRKFLRMWAIDRSLVDPLVDRVAADLGNLPDSQPQAPAAAPPPGSGHAPAPEAADES